LANKLEDTDTEIPTTSLSSGTERGGGGAEAMLKAHEDYEKMVLENIRKMGALKQQSQQPQKQQQTEKDGTDKTKKEECKL